MRLNSIRAGLFAAACLAAVLAAPRAVSAPDPAAAPRAVSAPDPAAAPDAAAAPDPAATDASVRQVAAANTAFGFRLLARLSQEQPHQNVFFSPFSLTSALTMALNGAGGTTRQEIARTLHLDAMTPEEIDTANGLLLPSLETSDPQAELSVANALWVHQGVTLNPDFQSRSRRFFQAQATALDFKAPGAAATINAWTRERTKGNITQLVTPSGLLRSVVVLTDAVYFHGKWTQPFAHSATQDQPFTREDGTQKTIPMMSEEGGFSYLETPDLQAVRLPYGRGRLALYVFLPPPGSSSPSALDSFVATVVAPHWDRLLSQMHPARLALFLPRFGATENVTLNRALGALGMARAFAPGADFRPMGLTRGVISQVVHQAVLKVDEEGTTAAAATGILMSPLVARPIPAVTMRIDHPFFCALRDDATGTILFLGAVRDPQ